MSGLRIYRQRALKIIVVSEAGAEQIQNGSDYVTAEKLIKDGLATEYELTLTQMKPRDDTNLDKVSIYDAYTGDRVYGEIKGDEITFELPYYFIDGNRKDHNQLYFDTSPAWWRNCYLHSEYSR